MPRRYLTPEEARDLRIMGQAEQIERDENGEDFIEYTSSEGSCSDDDYEEELAGDNITATELLLHAPVHVMTEDERIDAILNGELVGMDLDNLSERETQALQMFIDELAIRTGIVRPRPPMEREARLCMPQPEPELTACALQPQPQPNLLQVEPEEVNQQLLELAFAESPEVNIPELMQLLGAPGDPGDPDNGSVVVNDYDDEGPDLKHFTVMGGGRKRKSRSRKRSKKTKRKRKSKRKTRKRKSIR